MQTKKMKGCIKDATVLHFCNTQLIVDIVLWLSIGSPVLILHMMGSPYEVGFFCDDTSLKYPYKPGMISNALLTGVAFGLTTTTLLMVEVMNRLERKYKKNRCLSGDPFICLKGFGIFLFGFVIAQLFTEVLKNAVGRLRPTFFDVCRPDFSRIDCRQGYITNYTCTNDEHLPNTLRTIRQSFPSGHSVFSMFTTVYLVLYIEKRLHITYSHILKPTIQAAIFLLSLVCAVSRITDHKHHPSDVIAGLFIGSVVACAIFHSLGTKFLNDPKIEKTSNDDEEEGNWVPNTNGCQTPLPLLQNEFDVSGRSPSFVLKQPIKISTSVTV
ncbi:hypothetical protein CHS0354_006328 [Potamilus streckersoni]|uniref:Phosphatidic acid phosphatase type 2/haloperoxidase domain-containing protein n=1 Tax=Potamilus streckersoni TaxID=2493646 RepID=A0AAE0S4W3_9BIVA|nr:hypothetical protein CHS0354_006328 [Potamilus streckersoni]